eukprot:TRINITY_DN4352_c2_g1_i1.p2 TRINITY_DN4352_c2_g1~~TRINITY_DN4352_c2_g1_i1.p2  ORF type:complete len:428 (+),score=170.59 TRINITY_DN4352_c2_g1_i1:92-1285(+)
MAQTGGMLNRPVSPPDDDPDEHLTLAIILSLAAGLATCLGAGVAFFPKLQQLGSSRVLSASLALSAGVMLYVSFVEIFVKANDSITLSISGGYLISSGSDPDGGLITEETNLGFTYPGNKVGNLYTCFAFFGGMFVVWLLEQIVHRLMPHGHGVHDFPSAPPEPEGPRDAGSRRSSRVAASETTLAADSAIQLEVRAEGSPEDPKDKETEMPSGEEGEPGPAHTPPKEVSEGEGGEDQLKGQEQIELQQMGLLTALALGLHNFPEGFATFIATLQEPSLGAALMVAIAIHNIPEGVCVAMPVYYASGSKWKALLWCTLSGISEPIGGILGWAVLRSVFTDAVFGVAFGAVGGMMVYIVLHELLPMAHKHDPANRHTTLFLIMGMVIIALSLIAFSFA